VRRLFWAIVGIGIGVVIGIEAVRWMNRTKERFAPPNLARDAAGYFQGLGDRLKSAISEGRQEMAEAEITIRADLGLPSR